ncbi:hypothetical protein PAXRUDRAFT_393905 [Paxillus rubicundulus Ve08.2h10]|uniref:Uncharacterized protein n=1 Tax=Paxillus rubicundulus Ve08.2h10 TaxID=930991 RepID=A0A0D0DDD2_9AGAM|nr:hypothetical protein PAXRUDRAFT_393905 [Paxillus rubicundulus Ve08.2h10]
MLKRTTRSSRKTANLAASFHGGTQTVVTGRIKKLGSSPQMLFPNIILTRNSWASKLTSQQPTSSSSKKRAQGLRSSTASTHRRQHRTPPPSLMSLFLASGKSTSHPISNLSRASVCSLFSLGSPSMHLAARTTSRCSTRRTISLVTSLFLRERTTPLARPVLSAVRVHHSFAE